MADVLSRALSLALPPALRGFFLSSPRQDIGIPSKSQIRHSELSVDLAFMLLQRERCPDNVVRYMWSDSSPMAGYDWLWSQYHEISRGSLVELHSAVRSLEVAMLGVAETLEPAAEGDTRAASLIAREFRAPPKWEAWLRVISQSITEHINPPAALGSGFRGLEDKVKAVVFTWALQLDHSFSLGRYAESIVSHTSDMGVESSIPDFLVSRCEDLLPHWMDRRELIADVDDVGEVGRGGGSCDDDMGDGPELPSLAATDDEPPGTDIAAAAAPGSAAAEPGAGTGEAAAQAAAASSAAASSARRQTAAAEQGEGAREASAAAGFGLGRDQPSGADQPELHALMPVGLAVAGKRV